MAKKIFYLPRPVVLVGMMGAGKTTVGRAFSKKHHLNFIDFDRQLEQLTGVDVSTIFDIEGESGFRFREQRLLEQLLNQPNQLLATGGGIILSEKNRKILKSSTIVVYLDVSVDALIQRLRHDKSRPLLQVNNRTKKIIEIHAQRDVLYRQTAHIILTSNRANITTMVNRLHMALMEYIYRNEYTDCPT